jgi:hypothetical protein
MLHTLKYTPNAVEDATGHVWTAEELRRLHDALVNHRKPLFFRVFFCFLIGGCVL